MFNKKDKRPEDVIYKEPTAEPSSPEVESVEPTPQERVQSCARAIQDALELYGCTLHPYAVVETGNVELKIDLKANPDSSQADEAATNEPGDVREAESVTQEAPS